MKTDIDIKTQYSIDYFLQKDGSWISQGFDNETDFKATMAALKANKYKIAAYTTPDLGTITFTSKMYWKYN